MDSFIYMTSMSVILNINIESKLTCDGYDWAVFGWLISSFSSAAMHFSRLWQFSVAHSLTILSGTVGNFCFISWNNCIILILLHEQFVLVVELFEEQFDSESIDFCLNSFVSFEDELADIFSHYLLICTLLRKKKTKKIVVIFYLVTLTIVFFSMMKMFFFFLLALNVNVGGQWMR